MRPPAIALALALLSVAPATAEAARARCAPTAGSPACNFTNARVTSIDDGDTIRVKPAGSRAVKRIRLTGINSMEMTRYSRTPSRRRGFCHSLAATALIERYIKRAHYKVRLADQRDDSRSGERLRRTVWVKSNGRYIDLARIELEKGLALWLPNGVEWAHNLEYRRLAAQAAAAQKGLYDPDSCGSGPDQDTPLRMFINWDADHEDNRNLNDEWVELVNDGSKTLPLQGWYLRDSFLHFDRAPGGRKVPGYAFPGRASIPAGKSIRVHVGCGPNSDTDLHWCLKSSAFENVTYDSHALGDGAYLFDPQGDLRVSSIYPCVVNCTDPAEGRVRVDVHPNNPESVSVTNTGADPLSLYGYLLKLHNPNKRGTYIASYPFGPNATLDQGETVEIDLTGQPSNDTRLHKHWPIGPNVLRDGEGAFSLRTFTDIVITCESWGRARC